MSYSAIAVSVILAFVVANTSAHDSFDGQNVCDIKYHLHENLASVLENDVGIRIANELERNAMNFCTDPRVHDSVVALMDAVADLVTDPNASQVLGNAFFWAKKVVGDKNFRVVLLEAMKGLNMVFDNHKAARDLSETAYASVKDILNSPYFEETHEAMIRNVYDLLNVHKNLLYKAGTYIPGSFAVPIKI